MSTVIIKSRKCPFCKSILTYTSIRCPDNKRINCSECHKCDSYFLTSHNYKKLDDISKTFGTVLKSNIYAYKMVNQEPFSKKQKYSYQKSDHKYAKSTKGKSLKIMKRGNITYSPDNCMIKRKTCEYYMDDLCSFTNEECNLNSEKCPKNVSTTNAAVKDKATQRKRKRKNINDVGVTAIVLSDNRKCLNNRHIIKDVNATIRVADKNGEIINYLIPCAYCDICDLYFVFKVDYDKAKKHGVILCPVINRTKQYLQKHSTKATNINESRIHQLGYNVRSGSGYTPEQRHVILANIMENTNISKHEIESCILRPMMQHKSQPNYADAIKAWKQDLDFIKNYKRGDCPEVIIDKIIIGKRK